MEFGELVESRRSVHDYTDEPITDDTLEAVFEQVKYTPSGYNLQPWEFLVLRDQENLVELKELAYGQEHVTDAAATVVILGNTDPAAHAERVFDDWVEKEYLPNEEVRDDLLGQVESWRDQPDEENRVWTTRNTSLAAMTLMFAAWDHGIASCPMEGFDPAGVKEAFDIGDGYEPVMLVTLGYAEDGSSDVENPRKLRRPTDEIVHHEEFSP